MRGEPAIEVEGLRMRYGDVEAVRGVDLSVERGEVFALLGPNGAGKTTTVEILEGHRRRTAGRVSVLGHDPADGSPALRARIGVVLQSTGVERFLTVEEVLEQCRGWYPSPRPVDELVEMVGLGAQRRTPVRRLSGGQQRRLDVAVGLAGDPDLLFLDEPTTGFDPSARRQAWDLVRRLRALGKTIFLTTHYMDEAQHLADRVAVIASGRIVATGTPETLGGRATDRATITFDLPAGAPRLPKRFAPPITTAAPTQALHDLTTWATARDIELVGLQVTRPSLEDVYLSLVGEVGEAHP